MPLCVGCSAADPPRRPHRYEGNPGDLGREGWMHTFPAMAPALLGFDERIDDYCGHQAGQAGHAQACVNKNL